MSLHLTPAKAVLTIVVCALSFSVLGGLGGYVLGRFMPGYYRGVFSGGESPDFDPVAVGLGQGITQGLVAGGIIGLILVAILVWQYARLAANANR